VASDTRGRDVLLLSRSRPDGVMARRAEELARRSAPELRVTVVHRGMGLPRRRPHAVVVFDTASQELGPALRHRLRGVPVVVDAGDVVAELLAKLGAARTRVRYRALLERAAWRWADALVLRGEGFREVLAERGVRRSVDVLPDGVDLASFRPLDPGPGRRRLGLAPDDVAVGVVGSIVWSPAESTAYGWELVEALPSLPTRVKAVVVGEGDGLPRLRARADELGVGARLVTPGRVAHEDVPALLGALDAVSWTQTPDAVGRCRTTVKLGEYLACGRFVIASDVGEARRSVRENGVRVPYRGGRDPSYVRAVAEAVRAVAADPAIARRGLAGRRLAARYDWDRVAAGFAGVVRRTVAERAPRP
jgi:glycosyltransferase involved in cell wall biosynthesis